MFRTYFISFSGITLLLTLFTLIPACTSDRLDPIEAPEICDTLIPTFNEEMAFLVERTCAYANCHVSGFPSGDYTTYESMLVHLDDGQVFNRVLAIRDMPPNYADGPKKLTEEELELFSCWLENGYPEN